MDFKLKSYLRSHRRRWGLTQSDLAYLLGLESGTMVSRMERLVREPGPMAVVACRILFGVSPREMFPKHYSDTEEAVMQRAYSLYELLQGQ